MKKILLTASEAVPFIKTGGLADVVGALPRYFDPEQYDVRVMIPKYACMDQTLAAKFEKVAACEVELNWRKQYAGVLMYRSEGITWYMIDNEYYFAGSEPYGHIYLDAEKFAFFSKAVLTVLPLIDFCPDVIHCNDWQTGWIPVFLKAQFQDAFYRHIKTIFTIHNMRFQGRWYMDAYRDITGLPDEYFTMDKLESYGQANPFKGGIVFSDFVTTVSQSYAWEIQESVGGEGLDGLMRQRSGELFGIVNGLDYKVYDPVSDPLIVENFDADSWDTKKKRNKKALQKELGLKVSEDVFLIGMVSRMTDQKGFDLVAAKLDELMEYPDIQIAVQGTGEDRYQDMFRTFSHRYPGRIAAKIQYSETLAHRIYASADAFLMPSMFEPCGLSQMISLRYGTVPMVRETGGLKDTVQPYEAKGCKGNGFTFVSYNADDMMQMVGRAHDVFKNHKEDWKTIALHGMEQDHSWEKSVKEYAKLYEMLDQIRQSEIREEARRQKEEARKKKEQAKIQKEIAKTAVKRAPKKTAKAAQSKTTSRAKSKSRK